MWTALISPIATSPVHGLSGKVETKKAETATKVAKARAEAVIMEKKATGEIDWDMEMAEGSKSSWKDEWLTILFSIPLILAFVPGMEEVVANCKSFSSHAEWYQYSLGVIVAASFCTQCYKILRSPVADVEYARQNYRRASQEEQETNGSCAASGAMPELVSLVLLVLLLPFPALVSNRSVGESTKAFR